MKNGYRWIKRWIRLWFFNHRLASLFSERKHILVVGDSHVNVIKHINRNGLGFKRYRFDHCSVGGATAQGVLNPGSKTDARKIFIERVQGTSKQIDLLFLLGEVDCGFVIWYYAEKFGNSVEDQLERSLKNYEQFLLEIKKMGFQKISVLSAPLPTIVDGQDWGDIAKKRTEVKATQLDRTNLTLKFNQGMKAVAMNNGFTYVDITEEMLDTNTGLIRSSFKHKNTNNHHLDDSRYSEAILRGLDAQLNR